MVAVVVVAVVVVGVDIVVDFLIGWLLVIVVRGGKGLRSPGDRQTERDGDNDPRSSMARPQCHSGKVPNGGAFRSSRHRVPDATVPGPTLDPGTARTVGTDAIMTGTSRV